jgi:hypothetical protein
MEIALFLRSSESQLKNRQGILNGRRVDFFKGTISQFPTTSLKQQP